MESSHAPAILRRLQDDKRACVHAHAPRLSSAAFQVDTRSSLSHRVGVGKVTLHCRFLIGSSITPEMVILLS